MLHSCWMHAQQGAVHAQDFFQILQPGLQLLRPPKRDARDGPGVVAGFVAYNYDAFTAEFSIEPWQARVPKNPKNPHLDGSICLLGLWPPSMSPQHTESSVLAQWPHVLALMGDNSDNVPGLKGIGLKSALQLVQQFDTVDSVLEHAAEVRGRPP